MTTDPELDDLNSMLRLLRYSNETRLEGLVYSASQHHWSGDGRGTTYLHENRGYTEPRTEWRWKPGQSHIEHALDAYEQVYRNLRRHDGRYPTPRYLRSKYRVGNIEFEGDTAEEWGGPNTIARALMSIEERYKGTSAWPAIYRKVSDKAIITARLQDRSLVLRDHGRLRGPQALDRDSSPQMGEPRAYREGARATSGRGRLSR